MAVANWLTKALVRKHSKNLVKTYIQQLIENFWLWWRGHAGCNRKVKTGSGNLNKQISLRREGWKCVEAVKSFIECGGYKFFTSFNRYFPHGFSEKCIVILMGRLPKLVLYMRLRKEMDRLFKDFTWNNSRVVSCRITEHQSLFIGSCVQGDSLMLPSVIWTQYDIAWSLQ